MSWISKTFSSSIGRKIIMALTGLFLCSFLVVHLIGNLQLFKDDGGAAFNIYSHFMGTNPLIRTLEWGLVLGFGFHIYEALILTRRNQAARGIGYVESRPSQNSSWQSRNMGLLGTIILVFLLVHLYNFFWRARFGDLDPDINNNDDLYTLVVSSFHQWWYVLLYVLAQVALCYHLIHGFRSAFQTVGLNHRKYTPAIKIFGYVFSVVVCAGFAAMPLYFYFFK
ncbi:succinate dehydrogenase / fumarate reductase cytochrome b subunit [Hymenobacter daecheongensis DSM 21074]|uniref:Succinate dehydrogenase / fumarate reductase cytochrome b subunit n=1 Tax=Hymenobacter daecheongensis DSM 21074 TaxID=1121955 RepID=A0A1M6FYR9_9BACT|nr:succinate dehydrogenase cytochrome b subunit [Hymenobacter daecheongensis]SHJ02866.1 succinate dehydrogenase / fumarate reductase cytochrome b subunit [Hymenobacter daecheongensis DSM 21074]